MSDIYTVPYSTFSKRLDDWLIELGGEVTNLTLDLFNRAQDWLLLRRDWEDLIVRYELTLSNDSASLPSDLSRILRVWHDSDGDGKPDFYYYAYARHDDGYYVSDSFTKSGGHSKTATFYRTPSHTPTVEYIKTLEHFTGSGVEYSFFPPDLLLRTAQKTHIEEADLVGNEYQAIINSHAEMLRDYEASHQYRNRDMRSEVLDDHGDPIDVEQYNLSGDTDRWNDGYDNSYDFGVG
jgi:hypothetical protein